MLLQPPLISFTYSLIHLRFIQAHTDKIIPEAIICAGLTSAGTLSESLSAMAGLTTVNLARNNFTGTLPSSWSSMAALTSLELGENNLTGADVLPCGQYARCPGPCSV